MTSATEFLRKLRASRSALASVLREMDEAIATVQAKVMPRILKRGIATLPDELLARILELAGGGGPFRRSTLLSLVNLRFRSLMLKLPIMWAHINVPGMSSEMTTFSLERSANAGLDVDVDLTFVCDSDSRMALDDLFPHAGRWRKVSLIMDGRMVFNQDETSYLGRRFADMDLPELESLHVHSTSPFTPVAEEGNASYAQDVHFYATCAMSSLRQMLSGNFIPRPFVGAENLHHLTVNLSTSTTGQTQTWDFNELLMFLSACPVLTDLALSFRSADSLPVSVSAGSVKMFNLERLSIDVVNDSSKEQIGLLLRAMDAPNIENMSVTLDQLLPLNHIDQWIEELFPNPPIFPAVKELSFSIVRPVFGCSVGRILSAFPKMQRFAVTAPRIAFIGNCRPLPALRTLHLKDYGYLRSAYAAKLFWALGDGDVHREFEELKMENCSGHGLDLETLQKLLPGKRIIWQS